MKILSSRTGGRLANLLYFALLAYILSLKTHEEWKYTTANNCFANAYNLAETIEKLNLEKYVINNTNLNNVDLFLPINNYYLQYNIDFTEYQLKEFIQQTILKTISIPDDNEQSVAVHIRNGDYLNIENTLCFDKITYLKKCFETIPASINILHIFSDDNDLNYKLYDNLFKSRFSTIIYENNLLLDDFIKLSSYRYKILWNSTFSFWSGFVGDVLYSNHVVCCPNKWTVSEKINARINTKWNIVDV